MQEELRELMAEVDISGRTQEEAGDLLFAVVNLLRKLKIDAEDFHEVPDGEPLPFD